MSSVALSSDSKKIAYSDRKQNVYYVDINSKENTKILYTEAGEIRDYNWSPDSKYLTYTAPVKKGNSVVNVYSLSEKKNYTVTDTWFDSYAPSFSSDGK